MGTPIDELANLTLGTPTNTTFNPTTGTAVVAPIRPERHEEMPRTTAEIEARALEVRDILSTFDGDDLLPQEFRLDVFDNISLEQSQRPNRDEWTKLDDLTGTLMRWGSYREDLYRALMDIQPRQYRPRLFREKARRRFDVEFAAYDELIGSISSSMYVRDRKERLIDVHTRIPQIAKRIANLVQVVGTDEHQLQLDEKGVAVVLLYALREVCLRNVDPERHGQARTRHSRSLCRELLLQRFADGSMEFFVLDELEDLSDATLTGLQRELSEFHELLAEHNADQTYQDKFGELVESSRDE